MQTEIQDRAASLNTQLRFGKHKPALEEAYKLRLYIQLNGVNSENAARLLKRVEKVIAELERKKTSGIQKLVRTIILTAKASLDPENDPLEKTLLDRFADEERPVEDPLDEHSEMSHEESQTRDY